MFGLYRTSAHISNTNNVSPAIRSAYAGAALDSPAAARYTHGMENKLDMTKKRLSELSQRAERRGIVTSSEFLTPAEQAGLLSLRPGPFELDGGYPGAERRAAVFLPWEGAEWASPVACLEVSPVSARFAEELGHRDCLGALMSLGVRREVLGDIVPVGGKLYVLCLESISGYIAENLSQIRHTSVRAVPAAGVPEPPEPPEESSVVAASVRLDALVAAVYKLSRSEAQRLFERELVLVNSLPARGPAAQLRPGDVVSVRGHGRFAYCGPRRETRKGRLRVRVRIY